MKEGMSRGSAVVLKDCERIAIRFCRDYTIMHGPVPQTLVHSSPSPFPFFIRFHPPPRLLNEP